MGFSALAGYPDPTTDPGPDFQQAFNNTSDQVALNYEVGQKAADANAGAPVEKIVTTFGEDGTPKYDFHGVSERTKQWLTEMAGIGLQTKNAFDQAANLVAAKRQFLTENPIIGSLGSIASHAAAAYQAPYSSISGLVRGAGVYGLGVFGQTPQELATEEAGLRSHEISALSPIANEQIAEERTQRLLKLEEDRAAHWAATEKTRALSEAERTLTGYVNDARVSGAYTPGVVEEAAKLHGFSDSQARNWEDRARTAYQAYKEKREDTANQELQHAKDMARIHYEYALKLHNAELEANKAAGVDPKSTLKINNMVQLSTKYEQAAAAKSQALNEVQNIYRAFQANNIPAFQGGSVTPDQAYQRVFGALGSGTVKDINGTAVPVADILKGVYGAGAELTAGEVMKIRSELESGRKAVGFFNSQRKDWETAHAAIRSTLPKDLQQYLPPLDGSYNAGTAPGTPAAPAGSPAGPPPSPNAQPAGPPPERPIGTSAKPDGIYPKKGGGHIRVKGGLAYAVP